MNETELRPTDGEFEILKVLWTKKSATVREVHNILGEKKHVGYTTTLKLMQIMNEKGLIKRDASTKSHVYTAEITQKKAQKAVLKKVADTLFEGSAYALAMSTITAYKFSKKELESIRKTTKELEKKSK